MKEKIVVPYAPILVESTRSIGYSFEAAVADIIDNSISAMATEIRVCFMSQDPQWLCIEDNGWGMSSEELENAMRYGSQSSQEVRRKDDLGRFGLGLKMASLSQCRKLTVLTKKNGVTCGACWDLDYIVQQGDWALKFFTEKEIKNMYGASWLDVNESGTVVIWEQFDRLKQGSLKVQKAFDEKIEATRKHVALVFHRFLGKENLQNRIAIYFNGEPVNGVDPFLTNHPATQPLSEQILRIGSEEIKVKPYVLPYLNKMSKQDLETIGGNTVGRSERVYKYRGRNVQSDNLIHVWNPIDDRGKLQYQINRELPVLNMLDKHLDDEGSMLLDAFIKMLEDAFPYSDVYYRMAKNEANVTESSMESNDVYVIADQMVQQIEAIGGDVSSFIKTMDKMDFFIKYPDVVRQIREVYEND